MTLYYVLNAANEPEPCDDILAWGHWMAVDEHVRVSQDFDEGDPEKRVRVSTVFLGVDHNFSDSGPPVLWETMVFGGTLDGEMRRYTSHAAALAGHQDICARVSATVHREEAPPVQK